VLDTTRFDEGLRIRSEVLGEDHVRRSMERATAFGRPMQDLVTEYCWGEIWGRPGLDRKTRSLLNLAMLTALNRREELAAHVRGALTNGADAGEIQEVLLQAAIYCGVPAALDAFRCADKVLADHGIELKAGTS
jgi:4-carboxymuconolactone decarboxylase